MEARYGNIVSKEKQKSRLRLAALVWVLDGRH